MKNLLILCSVLLLTACGQGSPDQYQATLQNNHIIIAGSTTVTPLISALANVYTQNNPVTIEVQELGTTTGINSTISGVSHIAMSSRSLSDAEIDQGLTPIPIAMDGVAIIVHPNNPVYNLSLEQITAIFKGEITNWSEVGGNDAGIVVVSREEGSGIRTTFESFANVQEEIEVNGNTVMVSAVTPLAIISSGTGGIIASVSGNENAIGYVTTGVVSDAIKSLSVNGVFFSEETVRNGSYIFANVFYLGVMESITPVAQNFIDWILSEDGQNVVSTAEFVRIIAL